MRPARIPIYRFDPFHEIDGVRFKSCRGHRVIQHLAAYYGPVSGRSPVYHR
jgi:hypothetical protein